ncbi:MAG: protein kinase [Candidatus Obscuribacterales bacterium]
MSNRIRVLIVEDQEFIRLGLTIALQKEARLDVVATASDGLSAVSSAIDLKPDVVLMDIGLPGIDGIEAAKRVKGEHPQIHVIMFTSHIDDDSIFTALAAGADGYCSKEASSVELAAAIETVYKGAIWLPPPIANRVLRTFATSSDLTVKTIPQKADLDSGEIDILSQIVQGKSGDEIARDLNLELSTVLSEMHVVIDKLARSDRARAALSAMRSVASLEASDDPLIGKVFAERYEILSQVGVGGMSTVYRARHKFMNNDVAIKILAPKLVADLKSMKRFRQEAQVTSSLEHPNIVTAHDFGITPQGQIFLIMDFVEGRTLASIITESGSLPSAKALNIFVQLCDALEHAHQKKIIHRDLKPGNIIISESERGEKVKVVDFGIAKISQKIGSQNVSLTAQGEVFGSPVYMSPEQCTDSPMDERSDLYSLGCLMFETLTGRPPFYGSSTCETIRQQVFETAPAMSLITQANVPLQLEQVVQKCLQKDPTARFDSARQVRDELLRCCLIA